MSTRCTISVIIPAYNAAAYLGAAIDSALQQTLPADEIIVVDDGSTDQTAAVAKSFGQRIRCILQKNSGAAVARNHGIQEARGEWVAFLDADDLWFPQKLAVQTTALDAATGPTLLCASMIPFVDTPPAPLGFDHNTPPEPLTLAQLLRRNRIVTSTVLLPRDALVKIGGFDARYHGPEDFALWLRLARGGLDIWHQQVPLAGCRIVPGSLCRQVFKMRDQELQVIRESVDCPENKIPGRLRAEAYAGVHFRAGVALAEAGQSRAAFRELIHSTLRWPFGLTAYSRKTPLVRLRLLRRILFLSSCQSGPDQRH